MLARPTQAHTYWAILTGPYLLPPLRTLHWCFCAVLATRSRNKAHGLAPEDGGALLGRGLGAKLRDST